MGKYDFTNLRNAIVQNEIPQEQVHNATPTNPLLVSNPNMGWNTTGGVDRSSEYYKAGQQARKNALFESIWKANEKPKSSNPLEAKYIDAKDKLDSAKNNLSYATDPEQERQLRAELKTAQANYDAAQKEYSNSKMQEAQVLTEEQASGNAPITTKSGRTYVGTGKKAQNPEKAAQRTAELQQAANALNEAKTNLGYATDPAQEAEARKTLNEAQANYDRLLGKHYVSDEERVGLVGKGAAKGWGADMMNAGATAAAGLSQLSEKLGGDTGEYAGWATDEVSRTAIPEQHDSKYYENQRQEIADIQNASDRLAASGQADIENAKKDTRGITKLAVDIGSNAVQMGMDGLAAVLTGGSSLGSMFARSAGGAAREARQSGASVAQQVAYGVVRGGIEVATEKMFDGLAGVYGAGAADDVVELVIDKMAKSDIGRTALRTMFSGIGEAVEEGISGATEPLTQAIYKGIDSIPKGYNKEQASDVLYSMLVGFAMGGAGGSVNIMNGNNAAANAELRQVDAIRNSLADTAMANTAGPWLSTGRDPNAGLRPSAEFEERNVKPNQQANNPLVQNNAPTQQNIDNTANPAYNNSNRMNGGAADDAGRSVGENQAGVPGVYESSGADAEGQGRSGEVPVNSGLVLLSEQSLNTIRERGVVPVEVSETTTDNAAFSSALADAHNADTANGWAVTTKSAEELNEAGTRTFMNAEGSAGFAVAPDGDIEAVFANKAKGAPKGVTKTTIPTAIANGGTKLDCYGPGLVRLYEQYGFVPVARVTFNPEYANEGWTPDKGTPDIYFMMHNGDAADTVVQKHGTYQNSTQADLDALPVMEYDDAYSYRDGLIAQRNGNTNESATDQNQQGPGTPPSGETWTGDEVQTQSTFHNQLTEEEKARDELNPENDTHVQHHDVEVDERATSRIGNNPEAARSDLLARDPAEWDDVDVRAAQMILGQELEAARQLTGEEQDAAYKRIAELKNAYNRQGTAAGQALRQRQRFGGTKTEMVSEAANILYGDENAGQLRKLSPEQKSQIMQQVDDFTTRLESVQDGDTKSLKDIIMEVAKIRNTHGILDFGQGKLGKVIDAVAKMDDGMDFLRQIATTQIRSIAGDQIKASFADKAKAIRYMNMLSNPATASRNVGANTVFGNFIDAISSNLSSPVDAFMGLFTGRRTVANERISKAGLKGSIDAGLKSWLEVTLDAEAEQSTYAYNEIKGRTFKANGNFVERLMSAFERNQGYQLKTTDQIAKGGIEAEQRRALGKFERKGKLDADSIETLAQEEAKYRTLQNESPMSKVAQGIRGGLNWIGIPTRDKATGKLGKPKYGAGEDLLPFAQVPANVVQTELNMNPLAIFPAIGKVFGVMAAGKNATPQQQRAAAKAFGQAVNGTAMVAAAALMSAKGVLRYTHDDDKDQKQLHKAQGKSGLQINFSAAARMFTGGDPTEQAGDKWGNIGWIPQLNSLLIIGNIVYEDYKDMPEHSDFSDWAKFGGDVALDSLKGMYESILEFPAVSTISSMINAGKYANVPEDASDAERFGIRLGSVVADKVANTATGFALPNVLRATAAGLDDTERNLYGAENRLYQALDSIKAGIPDNPLIPQQYTRGSLPAQTDNFGNPIKNEGGAQQFLNKVILPGAITTDRENAVLDEIDRVAMASGNADAIPDKNGAYTVTNGKDKYRLTSEERIAYQQYAGRRSEEYIRSFINSSLYSQMNDDQRAETMAKLNQQAKSEANKHYLEQRGIKSVDKLTEGKNAPGTTYDYTPLNKSNIATYYAYETMMKQAVEDGDYKTIDNLARRYTSLNGNLQTVLSERDDSLRAVLKWSSVGISSQTYYSFIDASKASQARLDKSSRTGSTVELDALANMNISEAEKRRIIDNVEGVGSKTVIGVYDILSDYGFDSKQINEFWTTSQNWVYKDTGDTQSAQKAGTLQPLEAYYAIEQLPGLDDAQRTDIYNRMKEVANVPYKINDWGNYTFQSERNYYTSGRSKQEFGVSSQNPLASAATSGAERPRGQQPNYIMQALQGMAG